MFISHKHEAIDQGRRRLLVSAAQAVAVAGAVTLLPPDFAHASENAEIRPFRVNVSQDSLIDLRRRINATRWPSRETVDDNSQGI